MTRFILVAALLLHGCASQDPWTTGDTVWQSIALATMAADAHMTTKIRDHPNIVESGPISTAFLGQNPDPEDVWLYMVTVGISHYLIARSLPSGLRTLWQVGAIYRHGMAVNDGHQLGLFSEPCTVHPCEELQ